MKPVVWSLVLFPTYTFAEKLYIYLYDIQKQKNKKQTCFNFLEQYYYGTRNIKMILLRFEFKLTALPQAPKCLKVSSKTFYSFKVSVEFKNNQMRYTSQNFNYLLLLL